MSKFFEFKRVNGIAPQEWWQLLIGRYTFFFRRDVGKRFPILVEVVKDYTLG